MVNSIRPHFLALESTGFLTHVEFTSGSLNCRRNPAKTLFPLKIRSKLCLLKRNVLHSAKWSSQYDIASSTRLRAPLACLVSQIASSGHYFGEAIFATPVITADRSTSPPEGALPASRSKRGRLPGARFSFKGRKSPVGMLTAPKRARCPLCSTWLVANLRF